MTGQAPRVTFGLLGLSALSLVLLALRMLVRSDAQYGFLAWNLLLAWIPLLLAVATVTARRLGVRLSVLPLLVLWLIFFPNAPYVVTDFVHLRDIGGMPRWFDALMLGSFSASALALGFVSLYLVQNLVRDALGAAWSWAGALAAIALSGVGIYLGRVAKLNSWDVLNPDRLRAAFSTNDGSMQDHRVLLTLFLTSVLAAAYVVGQHLAGRRARGTFNPSGREPS